MPQIYDMGAEILNNLNSVVKRMLKELLSQKFLLQEPFRKA
jgi:hypothetical protein